MTDTAQLSETNRYSESGRDGARTDPPESGGLARNASRDAWVRERGTGEGVAMIQLPECAVCRKPVDRLERSAQAVAVTSATAGLGGVMRAGVVLWVVALSAFAAWALP
jgi:hypothetical protein